VLASLHYCKVGGPIMDRAMQLAHLAQAERHIISGIRHIERQEQIIADLDCNDRDITIAVKLLWTFRDMQ
jgi:hypothetical protein